MTNTMNQTSQSCTGYPTPETDVAIHDVGNNTEYLMVFADFSRKLERERDEAIRSCHIWQKGHSDLVADRDDWKSFAVKLENAFKLENDSLKKHLSTVIKQNNERLTILQEHGLAEYGN